MSSWSANACAYIRPKGVAFDLLAKILDDIYAFLLPFSHKLDDIKMLNNNIYLKNVCLILIYLS